MSNRAPVLKSVFVGGWSPAKKQKLDAVKLPDKTRCFDCGKLQKTRLAFSEKKLTDLRNGMASGQIKEGQESGKWIICRSCVGGQTMELTCIMCDVTKSLDGFAKTHRRNPDNARCLTCVAEVGNSRPLEKAAADAERDHSDDSDTDSNPYSVDETEDQDSQSGVRLPSQDLNEENLDIFNASTRGHSTQATQRTASISASMAPSGATSKPGVSHWQEMSRSNKGKTGEGRHDHGHYVGYDPRGKAHRKTFSSQSSASGDSDVTTTQADDGGRAKPEPKFAKVKAVERKIVVPEYKPGRTVDAYDSEEDEDDDDYFTI